MVLEKYLREKGAKALRDQGQAIPATDPTDPHEYDRQLREELGPPPPYAGSSAPQGTHGQSQGQAVSTAPQDTVGQRQGKAQSPQAQAPERTGSSWRDVFGSKKKQPDIERGNELQAVERPGAPAPTRPARPGDTAAGKQSTRL